MRTATRRRVPRIGLVFVSLLAVFGVGGAPAPVYEFLTIPPPAGSVVFVPNGITNDRIVTGGYVDSESVLRGFLYTTAGGLVPVDYAAPGVTGTWFYQPNQQGQVAVAYGTEDGKEHAAVFDLRHHAWTPLRDPDSSAFHTLPGAINDRGQLAGNWTASPDFLDNRGFVYERGRYTPIEAPGAAPGTTGTVVNSVNNRGDVLGAYTDRDGVTHGFVRDGRTGRFTPIEPPAGVVPLFTMPSGINDQGVVAGAYYDGETDHGFLWRAGQMTIVDLPGVDGTILTAINDRGDVVGYGYTWEDGNPIFQEFIGLRRGQ